MKKLSVIKIGGKVIDDQALLDQFLQDFAELKGSKILVHGGGKIASDFGTRLGIEPKMNEGRRITDAETLELVTMVYGGLVNKKIVSYLQALGEDAIGLSGADANVLKATKRPVKTIDYGFAGDITSDGVNKNRVSQFLESGLTPVICALTHDGKGSLLNTNADTLASVISGALSSDYEVRLIYCFEQKGVLSDFENQTVIEAIDMIAYDSLKANGVISDGMIPKLDNAFAALNAGVKNVRILQFSDLNQAEAGTLIGT
ncbi:acetylglutamate kinase [Roseivirga sp. 4D4]|uniref:acetylglutamate kinase n=1 Tax=Roseivirga sp. 4D4 TaxID=1889784 RepID=UPI0008537DAF|nr:acetylglutamate kinase [Roseivirga sp. 4D4]OEK03336.1 acetylglutamate kinase [Roseivirga sp. 4D4]